MSLDDDFLRLSTMNTISSEATRGKGPNIISLLIWRDGMYSRGDIFDRESNIQLKSKTDNDGKP